jgi:CubicO group peptidase (beta-lactamase class C family)
VLERLTRHSLDLYGGGGGLVSTVDDLTRFYRALLGGRVFAKPATLQTMLGKPHSTRLSGLGMGIFAESVGRASCWHHDGFWGITVLHCPGARVTIAISVNQANNFGAAGGTAGGRDRGLHACAEAAGGRARRGAG